MVALGTDKAPIFIKVVFAFFLTLGVVTIQVYVIAKLS